MRSGKAIHIHKRIKEHTRNKDIQKHQAKSAFYTSYFLKWNHIEWYKSLALDKHQLSLCTKAMYESNDVKRKLETANWPTKNHTYEWRSEAMTMYLSELVDSLLMARCNTVSEAPGFESPIGWEPVKKKIDKKRRDNLMRLR